MKGIPSYLQSSLNMVDIRRDLQCMYSGATIIGGFSWESFKSGCKHQNWYGHSLWVTFLDKNFSRSKCQNGRHFQDGRHFKIYVFLIKPQIIVLLKLSWCQIIYDVV